METVDCNLCGSSNYREVFRQPDEEYHLDEWFSVVRCESCGLGFVNPRPTREEIGKYYPSAFYDHFVDHAEYHRTRYQRECRYITRHLRPGQGHPLLLDVGCANGDFPRFAKEQGFRIEGVEVSNTSRSITDFRIYQQEFPSIPVTSPTYDVVTAWAVIEHVHDPKAYFHKAAEVLMPQGLLVFLVTNFESLASKALYREDTPRHLYLFTEPTVRRYLDEAGFDMLEADYSDAIYPMMPVNWLRYYLLHRLPGRPFTWHDTHLTRHAYFKKHGLEGTPLDTLRFAIKHPLSVVDRLTAPLYGRYEMLIKRYGIVTYVARRRGLP